MAKTKTKKKYVPKRHNPNFFKDLLGRSSTPYSESPHFEKAVEYITEFFDTLTDEEILKNRFLGTDNNVSELFMNSLFVFCNMYMSLARQLGSRIEVRSLTDGVDNIIAVCDVINYRSTVVSKNGSGVFPLSRYEKDVLSDLRDVHIDLLEIVTEADLVLAWNDTLKNVITSRKNIGDRESAILTNYDFWGVTK